MVMQRSWQIPFILLLVACPYLEGCCPDCGGFAIYVDVSVPPEFQQAFSATTPGLVVDQYVLLGRLCDPTNLAQTFQFKTSESVSYCKDKVAFEDSVYGSAYVFRLTAADFASLSTQGMQALACGQSGPIKNQEIIDAVFFLLYGYKVTIDRAVASGTGTGSCDAEGSYQVNIPVVLR